MNSKTRLILTSSIVALMAASAVPALADAVIWTGDADSNEWGKSYTDGGDTYHTNWRNSGGVAVVAPTENDDVYIGPGSANDNYDTARVGGSTEARAKTITIGREEIGSGTLINRGALEVGQGITVKDGLFETYADSATTISTIGLNVGSKGSVKNAGVITVEDGGVTVGNGGNFVNTGILSIDDNDHNIVVNSGNWEDILDADISNDQPGYFNGGAGVLNSAGQLIIGANSEGLFVNSSSGSDDDAAVIVGGLTVGDRHTGAFYTDAGEAHVNGNVVVGNEDGVKGIAVIASGAQMLVGGRLDIGQEGRGYLVVTGEGSSLENGTAVIGRENGSRGYAVVTHGGSWESESLVLSGAHPTAPSEKGSQGFLVINEDGTVGVGQNGAGTLYIAVYENSKGVLNIGAYMPDSDDYNIDEDIGDAALGLTGNLFEARGAGHLEAQFVEFGAGQGIVNFKHTEDYEDDYRFEAGFKSENGNGEVHHYEGFTVLDGDSSGFTGSLTVHGGTVVLNNENEFGSEEFGGTVTVEEDGILRIGHEHMIVVLADDPTPGDGEKGGVANDITNNGVVEFNRSNEYTYDNVISGAGEVRQIGSGTTILTGANTYTGKTTIERGILQLGNGGTTGSFDDTSEVEVQADGTLAFNRSDIYTWDGYLHGEGILLHLGTGQTYLTGDTDEFQGTIKVQQGTLTLGDGAGHTVTGADIEVTSVLDGKGTMGSLTVKDGGKVAPGDDDDAQQYGTLTVNGDALHEAGSIYLADLETGDFDSLDKDHDFIEVIATDDDDGVLHIEEGAILQVNKVGERFVLEHRYVVQHAEGGLDMATEDGYELAGDVQVSTFYRIEDNYQTDVDGATVYLDVAQYRTFDEAALTSNQLAASIAAQELKAQFDPDTNYPSNELFRAIAYLQTDAAAQHAFDLISGEAHASVRSELVQSSGFVRDAVTNRVRNAFGLMERDTAEPLAYTGGNKAGSAFPMQLDPGQSDGTAVWADAVGSWSSLDGDGNAAQFDRNIGGIFAGIDTPVTENFRIGLMGGFSRASYDIDDRNTTGSSNNFDIGIYGGGQWGGLGLRLGANYTWHTLDFERAVVFSGFSETITSEYDGRTIQAYGDIGYTFDLGGASFEPFGALAYVNVKTDDYQEGGGVAALSGTGDKMGTGFGTLGVRAAAEFSPGVTAKGMVGWRHAFNDLETTATHAFAASSRFTASGVPLAENLAVVEAGLEAAIGRNTTFGLSYAGQFGDGIQDHGVRGNLDWKF